MLLHATSLAFPPCSVSTWPCPTPPASSTSTVMSPSLTIPPCCGEWWRTPAVHVRSRHPHLSGCRTRVGAAVWIVGTSTWAGRQVGVMVGKNLRRVQEGWAPLCASPLFKHNPLPMTPGVDRVDAPSAAALAFGPDTGVTYMTLQVCVLKKEKLCGNPCTCMCSCCWRWYGCAVLQHLTGPDAGAKGSY